MIEDTSGSTLAGSFPGPRIVVIGVTGSGKTTLAENLSRIFSLPHVELDALHWLPGWVQQERETFRQSVDQALASPAWVVDGNYAKARDIIWARATTLVWLNYPLPVTLWQLTGRTLRRMATREPLWNGNQESFRNTFMSKDSILLWALTSYSRLNRSFPAELALPENAHLQVIRLRSRAATARWLAEIQKQISQK